MAMAWFRFYAELNDFLPLRSRGEQAERHFDVIGPVKDLIESFGVPHTEVDLVLINGEPAEFSRPVHDGDRVSVYPVFKSLDVSSVSQVRQAPLPAFRFVLDVHLGRLAAYLRMVGFDTLYRNNATDIDLVAIVEHDRRVLLTRDRYLLMRSDISDGYCVRSTDPKQQLMEVVRRFDLVSCMQPFTRCMKCNSALDPVSRDSVLDRLPDRVRGRDDFRLCSGCGAVYWQGTHYARMNKILDWLKENGRTPQSAGSR